MTRAFWVPGGYVVGFDTYAYSGPNLEVTERALREWRLPILNDLIFGGVPHLGNPSAAALYPPQLLAMLMNTNRAMGVIVAAHVVLLGIGMLALARRLGLSPIGATSAGVIAMAAGSSLTKTVQFEQILVLAWIPMLLVTIHAVVTSDRPWRAVGRAVGHDGSDPARRPSAARLPSRDPRGRRDDRLRRSATTGGVGSGTWPSVRCWGH